MMVNGVMNKKLLKKKRFYFGSIAIILFLAIMISVLKKGVLDIDIDSYNYLVNHVMNDDLTILIKIVTNLGSFWFLIDVLFLSFFILKDKRFFWGIIANLGISGLFNFFLKIILRRERPLLDSRLVDVVGYSFPSGHAMVSMAFYGFYIYLLYVYVDNNKYKWPLILLLSIMIVMIGFSRVYLGVHYLSDVLAGFLIASSYLVIFVYLFNKFLIKSNIVRDYK